MSNYNTVKQPLVDFLVPGCEHAFVFGGQLYDPNEQDEEKRKEQEEENVKTLINHITSKIQDHHLVWALLGTKNEKLDSYENVITETGCHIDFEFAHKQNDTDKTNSKSKFEWECLQVAHTSKISGTIDEIKFDISGLFNCRYNKQKLEQSKPTKGHIKLNGHFHGTILEKISQIEKDDNNRKAKYRVLNSHLQNSPNLGYKYFCVVLIDYEEHLKTIFNFNFNAYEETKISMLFNYDAHKLKTLKKYHKKQINQSVRDYFIKEKLDLPKILTNNLNAYQISEILYAVDTLALIWNPSNEEKIITTYFKQLKQKGLQM